MADEGIVIGVKGLVCEGVVSIVYFENKDYQYILVTCVCSDLTPRAITRSAYI